MPFAHHSLQNIYDLSFWMPIHDSFLAWWHEFEGHWCWFCRQEWWSWDFNVVIFINHFHFKTLDINWQTPQECFPFSQWCIRWQLFLRTIYANMAECSIMSVSLARNKCNRQGTHWTDEDVLDDVRWGNTHLFYDNSTWWRALFKICIMSCNDFIWQKSNPLLPA